MYTPRRRAKHAKKIIRTYAPSATPDYLMRRRNRRPDLRLHFRRLSKPAYGRQQHAACRVVAGLRYSRPPRDDPAFRPKPPAYRHQQGAPAFAERLYRRGRQPLLRPYRYRPHRHRPGHRDEHYQRRHRPGRQHHYAAAGEKRLPVAGTDAETQNPGSHAGPGNRRKYSKKKFWKCT